MSAIPNLGVVSSELRFTKNGYFFSYDSVNSCFKVLEADGSTLGNLRVAEPVNNSDVSTKLYVDTAVANLVDSAPGALDTLNELAAALNDDADFATTVNNAIAAKQDALTAGAGIDITGSTISVDADATEIAADDTGHTYATGVTVDAQLSNIDTAIGNVASDVSDLVTLSGVAVNSSDLGTFTGSTIADSSTVKVALQSLETKVEQVENDAMSNMCRIQEFTFESGSTFNIDTSAIPSGKRIESVIVKIDTAFNDISATLDIGDGTTADRFMDQDDISLSYLKSQIEYPMDLLSSDTTIVATMSAGTSTQGAGVIMVKYC